MRDINLLPEDINLPQGDSYILKEKVNLQVSLKTIIITVLIIAIMIMTIIVPKAYIKIIDIKLATLQHQLLARKYSEVKTINNQLDSISSILASKVDIISFIDKQSYSIREMLECVKHVAPDGTTISSFEYNSNTVKISLKLNDYSQIAEFLLNVQRLGFLTPDSSMEQLSLSKDSEMQFSFNVAKKGVN